MTIDLLDLDARPPREWWVGPWKNIPAPRPLHHRSRAVWQRTYRLPEGALITIRLFPRD